MQKIIIKNFGPIKYAEIEVKKILVLIGEQASGKSTIAKLIYFFKSLKEDLFSQIYQDIQKDNFDIDSDLISPINEKFYNFFGSTFNLPHFEITFYYTFESNKYLKLTLNDEKRLISKFSDNLITKNFKDDLTQTKKAFQELLNIDKNQFDKLRNTIYITYINRLHELLDEVFEITQANSLFIISGRNATVSYSNLFEKYLFAIVQKSVEENRRKVFLNKEYSIDENLMLNFIERVETIKEKFKYFGNFQGLIEIDQNKITNKIHFIKNKMNEILKGEYQIDQMGEKIVFNNEKNDYVYLSHASSGQQESIRILQDIFINILDDVKVLRIIEEPEAHLFPVAQKQLIELLALMVNHNDDNQLIITTHSPYVLTVFNNLLFANRVVEKNPSTESEVAQIIPQDSWLSAKDFSAYSLANQSVSQDTRYCEPIFNQEKGTIQQNYLDTVSEILGGDFQALYSIHAKTFKRK
ncbi:AAA family ATPase [Dolichospermum sp. UHCC 0684]|uniref:AAA family ATPase n=1 Tax=unclassified Dolichospermum TaxID=2622029 RepID=UPI00144784D6|nr:MULTISPECIES: AAA family ATPase [unclassified Dolichospermum]MEA5528469.1 AAA family ATPase [Dolichospermum sp. UHCC 0684]MTJ33914.1 ATP-binding protein [Dolichospermum sp. UHCC 0260]